MKQKISFLCSDSRKRAAWTQWCGNWVKYSCARLQKVKVARHGRFRCAMRIYAFGWDRSVADSTALTQPNGSAAKIDQPKVHVRREKLVPTAARQRQIGALPAFAVGYPQRHRRDPAVGREGQAMKKSEALRLALPWTMAIWTAA
jgi:hypothetical protein